MTNLPTQAPPRVFTRRVAGGHCPARGQLYRDGRGEGHSERGLGSAGISHCWIAQVRYSLDGTCDSIIPRINFVSTIKPHDDDDDGSSDSGSVGSRAGQPGVASIWSCDAREHLRCSCTTPASDVYTLDVERCSEALNALAASASAPDMSTDGSRLDVAQHVIDCIRCIRPELPADVVFTCDRTLGNLATGGRDGELSDMASGGHSGLLAVAEYIGKHVCSSSLSAALMNVYELLRERS